MRTDISKQEVRFKLTDAKAFDAAKLEEEFRAKGFPEMTVIHQPKSVGR